MAADPGDLAAAYVTILPNMSEFVEKLATDLEIATASMHPEVTVNLDLDYGDMEAELFVAEGILKAFTDKTWNAVVDADILPLLAKVATAKIALDELGQTIHPEIDPYINLTKAEASNLIQDWLANKNATVDIEGDDAPLLAKLAADKAVGDATVLHPKVDLSNAPINLDFLDQMIGESVTKVAAAALDDFKQNGDWTSVARSKIAQLSQASTTLGAQSIASGLGLNSDAANEGSWVGSGLEAVQRKIAQAQSQLEGVSKTLANTTLDLDTEPFWAKIEAIQAALRGDPATMTIKGDIAPLMTEIAGIRGTLAAASVDRLASAGAGGAGGGILGGIRGIFGSAGGTADSLGWGAGTGSFLSRLTSPLSMLGTLFSGRFGSVASLAGFGPEHLVTTLGGVGASGLGALKGAGLLGTASLATGAVGMATDYGGLGQAAKAVTSLTGDISALSAAQQTYGKSSIQATDAQNTLNGAISGIQPVAQKAVVAAATMFDNVKAQYKAATGPAEEYGAEIITSFGRVAEAYIPMIGKFAAANTLTLKAGLQPFFDWLSSPSGGLGAFNKIEEVFSAHLPTAISAITNALEHFIRLVAYLAPMTGKLMSELNKHFEWENTAAGFDAWQTKVDKLLGTFHTWDAFVKILVSDISELFGYSAGLGTGIIKELTGYLDELHKALSSPGGADSLTNFFELHKKEVMNLIVALVQLGDEFTKAYLIAAPEMTKVATVLIKMFNAVLDFIGKFGGGMGALVLGFGLLAAKMGALGPLLFGISEGSNAGVVAHIFAGIRSGIVGVVRLVPNFLTAMAEMVTGESMVEGESTTMGLAMQAAWGASLLIIAAGVYELVKHFGALRGILIAAAGGFVVLSVAMAIGDVINPWFLLADAVVLVAAATGYLVKHFGVVRGLLLGIGAAALVATAGIFAMSGAAAVLDAIPIVALVVAIGLAIVGLVVGIIYLSKHWQQVWADIKNWFDDAVAHLRSGFGTLLAIIVGGPLIGGLIELAVHWQAVWSGMKTAASTFVGFFTAIPGEVESIIGGMASGITSALTTVLHVFTSIPSEIKGFFKGAEDWLVDAGKHIIDGLKKGLEDAWDAVKSWVSSKAHDVVGWFKDAFGIHSPAATMVPVGASVTQGLVVGMQQGSTTAISAAKNIADDISHAFGSLKAPAQAAASIKSMADFFSNLAKMFTSLNTAVKDAPAASSTGIATIIAGLNNLAATGAGGLSTAIQKVDSVYASCASAATAVMKTVTTTFTAISKLFDAVGTASKAATRTESMASVLAGLNNIFASGGPITTALGKVEGIFAGCYAAVTPAEKNLLNTFNAIDKMFNIIGTATKGATKTESMASIIAGLNNIVASGQPILTGLSQVEGIFINCYQMAQPAIKSAINSFNSITKLFNSVAAPTSAATKTEGMASIVAGLRNVYNAGIFIKGLLAQVESLFASCASAANPAITAAEKLFQQIGKLFTTIGNTSSSSGAVSGIGGIVSALKSIASETGPMNSALATIEGTLSKFSTAFTNFGTTTANGFDFLDKLPVNWGTLWENAFQSVRGSLSRFETAFLNLDTLVGNGFSALTKMPVNWGTLWENAFQSVEASFKKLGTTLAQVVATVLAIFGQLGGEIARALSSVEAQMKTLGENIMSGLQQGITAGEAGVVAAATKVGNAAAQAVKSATKTTSPSQVFQSIGMSLMEGLANGITQGFDQHVKGALSSVSTSLTSGLNSTIHANVNTGAGVFGNSTITPSSSNATYSPQYYISGGADASTVKQWKSLMAQHDTQLLEALKRR